MWVLKHISSIWHPQHNKNPKLHNPMVSKLVFPNVINQSNKFFTHSHSHIALNIKKKKKKKTQVVRKLNKFTSTMLPTK